jgi:hypothetical protein
MDIEINNIVKINLNLTLKNGATTLSIMTLSITTLSIMTFRIIGLFATLSLNDTQHKQSAEQYCVPLCRISRFFISMLSCVMLSVVILSVVMLSVVILIDHG